MDRGKEQCLCKVEGDDADKCMCVATRSGLGCTSKHCRNAVVDPPTLSPEASAAMSAHRAARYKHNSNNNSKGIGIQFGDRCLEIGVVCKVAVDSFQAECDRASIERKHSGLFGGHALIDSSDDSLDDNSFSSK